MGDKATAVSTMISAKVPTIPGSGGAIETGEEGLQISSKIGFPVMIKASAGGGGKGMRAVWNKNEFSKAGIALNKKLQLHLAMMKCI